MSPKAGARASQTMLLKKKTGQRWEATLEHCISPHPERTREHQGVQTSVVLGCVSPCLRWPQRETKPATLALAQHQVDLVSGNRELGRRQLLLGLE